MFGRSYWPWLWMGLVDAGVFAGLPLVCVAALALARQGRAWLRGAARPQALLWALALLVALLAVTGKNRGETARLWMIFMPLAAAGGAVFLSGERRPRWLGAALLAAMFVQTLAMRVSLEVLKIG